MEMYPILGILAANAPTLLILLIGAVVSLTLQGKAPQSSRLLLIVCIGETLLIVAQACVHGWYFPQMMTEQQISTAQASVIFAAVGITFNIIHAALFGLMIWAVFAGRSAQGRRAASAAPVA